MQTITLTGGNLFAVAAAHLGDATLWSTIADLNGMSDPWFSGLTVLALPDPQPVNSVV